MGLVPADLWGLWTHGAFLTAADERAAHHWLTLVLNEYPSVGNLVEDFGLGLTAHSQLCAFRRGEMKPSVVPRWLLMVYRALRERAGLAPLSEPEIKGDSPEAIRRRLRWACLAYYNDYIAKMADDARIDRGNMSKFLSGNDKQRCELTAGQRSGLIASARFNSKWLDNGNGKPRNNTSNLTLVPRNSDKLNDQFCKSNSVTRYTVKMPSPAPVKTRHEVLDRIAEQRAYLRAFGFRRLGLFGSFRHDRAHPDSDVDLLVEFEPGATTLDNIMGAADLLEAALGRRVEIVPTDALSPYIGPKILADAEDVPLAP